MNILDSMARNAIPFAKLGDPKAVREGSERTVLMPNGQKVIMVSLNGEWVTLSDAALEYTADTLPDPSSLLVGKPVVVDELALAIKTPVGLSTLPSITPYPRNRAGIVAAINALRAVGKNGVVLFEDEVYDISMDSSNEPIIPYRGISFIGVRPTYVFNGHVPDANFILASGTILDGRNSEGVVDGFGFELNNVDQASGTTAIVGSGANLSRVAGQFASNGQGGSIIDGFGFRNVKRAFDTGATQNIGLLYTTVNWCVCEDATMDWAFKFHNFQHCEFKYLVAKTNLESGSGFDFSANVAGSVLLPGNSTIDEIYNYCSSPRCRGVMFSARAADNCALNEVRTGRIQSNRYGPSSTRSISVTTTSGSSLLTVSAVDSAWLKVGMTLNFTGAVPSGISANLVYFVTSVDTVGNTITLASSNPFSTSALTPAASGTYTAKTGGFPSLVIGGNPSSLITACDFGGLDVECTGSTSPIVFSRIRNSHAAVLEQFLSTDGFSVVVRDSVLGLAYNNLTSGLTIDKDSSSVVGLTNRSAGIRVLSGNISAVNAYHQSTVVNTSATEYTVTINSGLATGFGMKGIQQGTGKVAFVAGSGVTIVNSVGLKTSGVGAEVSLVWVGKDSYVLTGSTSA